MARIFDDTCGDLYDYSTLGLVWSTIQAQAGNSNILIVSGEPGATANCLKLLGSQSGVHDTYLRVNLPTSYSRIIVGRRFKVATLPLTGMFCLSAFWDSLGQMQAALYVNADGSLAVWLGGNTGAAEQTIAPVSQIGTNTAAATIHPDTWAYIELDITFATSGGGAYTLRVNSQSVKTASSVTTAINSAGAAMLSVNSSGPAPAGGVAVGTIYCDDLYVNDTSGSTSNTFDGDIQGLAYLPDSAGQYTQMAIGGSAPAATNWQSVNQAVPDGDATYVYAASTGLKDTYKVGALPSNVVTIVSVTTVLDVKTDTSGLGAGAEVAPIIGNGASTHTGTAVSLNTSYADKAQYWGQNPLTSAAWNISDWPNIEVGHTRIA